MGGYKEKRGFWYRFVEKAFDEGGRTEPLHKSEAPMY
jgi:hypothetical protein